MTEEMRADAIGVVRAEWGDEVIRVAESETKREMTFDEFLDECTACGGNWGGMLLSGVKKLYPRTWDAIPDDMGVFAFTTICNLLNVLGIDTRKEA